MARLVERCAHRHPAAYVVPAPWSTIILWARAATLFGGHLFLTMDYMRRSYSLFRTIARPVASRFLFVGATEESHLWNFPLIETGSSRQTLCRYWRCSGYVWLFHSDRQSLFLHCAAFCWRSLFWTIIVIVSH